jgi:hypothetical protein
VLSKTITSALFSRPGFLPAITSPSSATPKGENVETTARWQGSQHVVVTQRANGSKLIQTYTLDQGAGHMIISTQIPGGAP